MTFENTKEFARQLDSEDKLNKYRDEFIFPKVNEKSNLFHGKFIGLQPKRTRAYVDEVMDDWANLAVEGHFMLKSLVGLSRAFSEAIR
jgi:kynureninase